MEKIRATQEDILNSISRRGVLPAKDLEKVGQSFVPSADRIKNKFVYFNEIERKSSRSESKRLIGNVLYVGNNSVMQVLCERPGSKLDDIFRISPEEIEERISNSLLIVSDKGGVMDMQTDSFVKILVPASLTKIAKLTFPSLEVDTVKNKKITIPGDNGDFEVRIPDYEKGLFDFLVDQEVGKKYFVHAVRLPTEE